MNTEEKNAFASLKNGESRRQRKQYLEVNRKLCHPETGEDIVITGWSGKFSNSDNVYQFQGNLFDKVDMVTDNFKRWGNVGPGVPKRTGLVNDVDKFDAGFFGFHRRHANSTDPQLRQLLEKTFEAIVDAGYHPSELADSNTGVFIAVSFIEKETDYLFTKLKSRSYPAVGCTRSMLANRISYFFKLNGPSYTNDSGCSSSLVAIEHAYRALRRGLCERAIVGGVGLCLEPLVSLKFSRLGVLSPDGLCKSFDIRGNGYVRAETISAILLENSKNARRIYAEIVHAKTNCDGFKEQGITFPSSEMQSSLIKEVYEECEVDPTTVTYVETHGSGTKVGDLAELNCLDKVLCTGRNEPLYVGSVKSNMGHSESASGMAALSKVLTAFETDYIPPNINFTKCREDIDSLISSRIKVVLDKKPLPATNVLVGINNFGFGGSNAHIVLRRSKLSKISKTLPLSGDAPRLICVSGRTKDAVETILNDVKNRKLDVEFAKLLHTVFRKDIPDNMYRGYSVVSISGETERSVRYLTFHRKQLAVVFSQFDKKWSKLGHQLLAIPTFKTSISRIQNVLSKEIKIDFFNLFDYNENDVFSNMLSTIALQIGIADLLKALELPVSSVTGVGSGELIAAYFKNYVTLDEAVLTAFHAALLFSEADKKENKENYIKSHLHRNLIFNSLPKEKLSVRKWSPIIKTKNSQRSLNYFIRVMLSSHCTEISIPDDNLLLTVGLKLEKCGPNQIQLLGTKFQNLVTNLLHSLGRLYECGFDMQLDRLYPKIDWPVSKGTPMLSSLIKWDYSTSWHTTTQQFYRKTKLGNGECDVISIDMKDENWDFLAGHVIDGTILFPTSGYLYIVWQTLAKIKGKSMKDTRIVFENVAFVRSTNLPREGSINFTIYIQNNHCFQILESGSVVVTGSASELQYSAHEFLDLPECNTANDNIMLLKEDDIYKELRVRGYQYAGQFCSISQCNLSITKGSVKWIKNWINFIDGVLQFQILNKDSRHLYVSTNIQLLIVDPKAHHKPTITGENEEVFPLYFYKNSSVIRSGGVEVRGLVLTRIPKRKHRQSVLEIHKFVPYETKLQFPAAIRTIMQIVSENTQAVKLKTVEIVDENSTDVDLISTFILESLNDMPSVFPEVVVVSKSKLNLAEIQVKKKICISENNFNLIVASKVLEKEKVFDLLLNAVRKTAGFILSRESASFDHHIQNKQIDVICVYETPQEKLILLRKYQKYVPPTIIDVSDTLENLNWLPKLQNSMRNRERIVLCAQNQFVNGILGLFNCLKKEGNGGRIACFFICDAAPKFNLNDEFYKGQLKKNLAVNVYRNSRWGTYRHLPLKEEISDGNCERIFLNCLETPSISNLKWTEGSVTSIEQQQSLVHVHFAAINSCDVMKTSGRQLGDVTIRNRSEQECILGVEFSGRNSLGKRVMGMVPCGALSSLIPTDSSLLWPIPENWSLSEGATVPVVYGSVLYALLYRAKLKAGQSILIHSGVNTIVAAAINIATHYKCTVFVTADTKEKADLSNGQASQLRKACISSFADGTYEQIINEKTMGQGVDVILNSSSDEKYYSSVSCLTNGGKFLQMGKITYSDNCKISLEIFLKQASLEVVDFESIISASADIKKEFAMYLESGIKHGLVKPLERTVFGRDEVVDAFKFESNESQMKTIVKIREETKMISTALTTFKGLKRLTCNPYSSYIIIGGLGGFGLELADWLILRGAKKIVLSSRNGIKTGYQMLKINRWQSYGVKVVIRTDDVKTNKGCAQIIEAASNLGSVDGIFNLAVELKDALFGKQSIEDFKTSLAAKAYCTKYMDTLSRKSCPTLRYFVMFSSVSCGRGNPGQTNYGMSNSILERICEQRKSNGYPATAVQWGAVSDVGLVAAMQKNRETAIGGTLPQKISSCLEVMDVLLQQKEPIVSSMVVANSRNSSEKRSPMDTVLNIIGITNIKTISLYSTFAELGVDSRMSVEIQQTLDREHDIYVTPQDLRTMTFTRFKDLCKNETSSETHMSSSNHSRRSEKQITNFKKLDVGRRSKTNDVV